MKRVVITGMGIYSCIGNNLEQVRNSLYEGKSGIGFDSVRKEFGYRSGLTGILQRPQLKGILKRRLRIGLPEHGEYAYLATVEALNNAGIDDYFLDNNEVGILYGNDSCAEAVMNSVDTVRQTKDTSMLGSGAIFQSMNSTVTMNLSVIFRLKGINFTISGACASGSHALGMGYLLIKQGLQNCIICGGAQEANHYSMGSFDALSAFSIHESEPQKASKPFDRDRDGLVPSGGAGSLILESYEHAENRGANILAEVIGYGFSSNGDHISEPNVDGPIRAVKMSLKDSGIHPSEIQYINAHATSTVIGDMNEAKALDAVFGAYKPYITSTKSMTGHEMWMAGASEIVYSILMMQNSFIAPNLNFENPDEYSTNLNIPNKTIETGFDCFLSNSFGFGGTNSALI
ncbi:MAG: 3-oxoacyl-[acyl-carrier-protein] synthase, partial [Bacteroidota bacterium]|nr:3-oxoacyl-[acyl-carrier-protein] synthase [Bacteroidota bacterium]